jgi:hypothetical protein
VFILGDELVFPPHAAILEEFWGLDLHTRYRHPIELPLRGVHRLPDDNDLAFFIEDEHTFILDFLRDIYDLQGPFYSPYNVPRDKQYTLYYVSRHAQ